MMLVRSTLAAALLGATTAAAQAMMLEGRLSDEVGGFMGEITLDLNAPFVVRMDVDGMNGTYDQPSRSLFDGTFFVGPFQTFDFLQGFSALTGTVFREDFGDGEYAETRINEAAIRIGTLDRAISAQGGIHQVAIQEVYNVDETTSTCVTYEEIFDPDTGDYIGDGPCLISDVITDFNLELGDHYIGTLELRALADVPVPVPAALLAAALAATGWAARRKV